MSAVLDTAESRHRHRGRVHDRLHAQRSRSGALRFYRGFRYRCPRCAWKSLVMRHRLGAEHQADRHQLECCGTVRRRLEAAQ